jgi:hypothetical protein
MPDIVCRNCGTLNRAGARFCARCGQTLAPNALAQIPQTFARVWQQSIAELRALYNEWIARRPAITGTLATSPQATNVNIVVQGLFGPIPFSGGSSTQPGLMLRVDTLAGNAVDVLMIGATRGAMPQRGDAVSVWGQWDASINAFRAWRITSARRGELTTARPAPLALISFCVFAFGLLTCMCSVLTRIFL